MPQLPTYKPSVSLPTNVVVPDFSQKTGIGELGRQVGKVLQVRGQQLVQEYDTVKAVSAYNAFSDSSRGMVEGLLKLESGAAEGAQDAYKEWYGKSQTDYTGMLNSQPQQLMFKNLAERKRATDLNHLARHEATQYKVQKKEALDGLATDTDSIIRASTANGLKMPVADFTAVDGHLETFLDELGLMFPGHDQKALRAKYTQLFRVAQMEEMMEIDPQVAMKYLETYKDDLSYVDNGTLKDAYPALKTKLKVETTRDNVDTAYHAMTAKFPTDPGKAINALYDEKVMQELGIDVLERDRVVNTFKSEIMWAKQQVEFERKDSADHQRKEIFELMADGQMKQALDILDQSEDFTANEQVNIWNVIHTRMSKYTDYELYDRLENDIANNKLTTKSEIAMYKQRGIADSDIQRLNTTLTEHQKNPATTQFLSAAFEWYDAEFEGIDIMEERRPAIKAWLLDQIHDPKNPLKGPEIERTLRDQVGTRDDVYSQGWFWWKESKTRAPEGEKIEKAREDRARGIEKRKTGSKPVKSEFAEDTLSGIPESAKAEIIKDLKRTGHATTGEVGERNILKMYQLNKDNLSKTNIGVTF